MSDTDNNAESESSPNGGDKKSNFRGWINTLILFLICFIPFFYWGMSSSQIDTAMTVFASLLTVTIGSARFFGLFPFFQDQLSKDWVGIIIRSARRLLRRIREKLSIKVALTVIVTVIAAIIIAVIISVLVYVVLDGNTPPPLPNTPTIAVTWSITAPVAVSRTFTATGTYDPEALSDNTLWVIIKPTSGVSFFPQPESCASTTTAVTLNPSEATWSANLSMDYVGDTSATNNYELKLYTADTETNEGIVEQLTEWCQNNDFKGVFSPEGSGLMPKGNVRTVTVRSE